VRSSHADVFNHDDEATGYDADVADESHPVRAAYRATLAWVVARAEVGPTDVVVDLGAGTGNLSARLPRSRRLVCVDVSERMLTIARQKLGPGVDYVRSDLLEWVDRSDRCNVVVSTYAIHHLTPEEKLALLTGVAGRLEAGGRFVVGDLMAAGRDVVPALRRHLAHPDVDELFEDEYAWFVDETVVALAESGFTRVAVEQLSDLSWGVAARLA
jgi:SAM-dependent methyltransferase